MVSRRVKQLVPYLLLVSVTATAFMFLQYRECMHQATRLQHAVDLLAEHSKEEAQRTALLRAKDNVHSRVQNAMAGDASDRQLQARVNELETELARARSELRQVRSDATEVSRQRDAARAQAAQLQSAAGAGGVHNNAPAVANAAPDGTSLFANHRGIAATAGLPIVRGEVPSTFYDKIYAQQNPSACDAGKLMRCQPATHLGFGYQVHRLVQCVLESYRAGKTAVFYPATLGEYAPECNHEWGCFFKPISSCQHMASSAIPTAPRRDEPNHYFPEDTPKNMLNPGAYVVGTVLKYLMRPNDRLQAILDDKVVKVDYAVHIRRGDKIGTEAWSHDLEQYMQALDRIANPRWNFHSAYGRDYGKRVFVATDERAIWDELKRKYPQYQTFHGDGAQYSRHEQRSLDAFLVEFYTMAQADYFVGTFSSQVSRMVYEIFHTHFLDAYERSWSLDDPWYANNYKMIFPMTHDDGTIAAEE